MRSTVILIVSVILLLASCSRNDGTEIWQKKRDNYVKVELVSIEDSLPELHAMTYPETLVGDTLILKDFQANDYIFTAYDISSGRTIGRFGKFGIGPGEIANFGGIFVDKANRKFYGMNFSQWKYVGFDLDEALGDPDYRAFDIVSIPNNENKFPFWSSHYVNDTTVICAVQRFNKDWTAFRFCLGRFDPKTGIMHFFEGPEGESYGEYWIDISPEKDLIVAAGGRRDCVNLYDMNGRLKKSIYGPAYNPEDMRKMRYNNSPVITEDRIYFLSQPNGRRWSDAEEIVELDLEGNYLRTLKPEIPIGHIIYHKGTNRLYFSSSSEPQFGYIQL